MTNTTKPTIRIHDISTNEVIDREMNDAEYAEYQTQQAAQAVEDAAKAKATADKAAILARLGLTEDELKTILE